MTVSTASMLLLRPSRRGLLGTSIAGLSLSVPSGAENAVAGKGADKRRKKQVATLTTQHEAMVTELEGMLSDFYDYGTYIGDLEVIGGEVHRYAAILSKADGPVGADATNTANR